MTVKMIERFIIMNHTHDIIKTIDDLNEEWPEELYVVDRMNNSTVASVNTKIARLNLIIAKKIVEECNDYDSN